MWRFLPLFVVWVALVDGTPSPTTTVPVALPNEGGLLTQVLSYHSFAGVHDDATKTTTKRVNITSQFNNGTIVTRIQDRICQDATASNGCQSCYMDIPQDGIFYQHHQLVQDDEDAVVTAVGVTCPGYINNGDNRAIYSSAPSSLKGWTASCINMLSKYCNGASFSCGLWSPQRLDFTICPTKLSTLDRVYMATSIDGSCQEGDIAITGGGVCGNVLDCDGVACAQIPFYLHSAYADSSQFKSGCYSIYQKAPIPPDTPGQQTAICAPSPPTSGCVNGSATVNSWGTGGTCQPQTPSGFTSQGYLEQNPLCEDDVFGRPVEEIKYSGITCAPATCAAVVDILNHTTSFNIIDPYGKNVNPALSSPAQSHLFFQCSPGYTIRDFPDGHVLRDYIFLCDGSTGLWYNFDNGYNWNVSTDMLRDCHPAQCQQPFYDPHGTFHKNNDPIKIVSNNDIFNGDTLWIACDSGYYPSPMDTRCGVDVFGNYDDPIPSCLPLPTWNVTDQEGDFYYYDIQPIPAWSNYTRIISYDVEYDLLFPTGPSTMKSALSTANGVTQSWNNSLSGTQHPQLDPRIRFITDENNAIPHVISRVHIRPNLGNIHSSRTFQAQWDNLTHSSPCGCTHTNPTGAPLNYMMVSDLRDNSISIKFRPDSLCTSRYRITGDADKLDRPVTYLDSYDAISAASCSLLTDVTQALSTVRWNMHGRSLRYCIEPLPRRVCETCTQFYGQEDDIYPTPSVCFNHTAAFVVVVRGRLSAAAGGASQLHLDLQATQQTVGIRNANVTGMLVQVNNVSQPFLDMDGNIVTATTISDDRGNYELILSSTRINASSPTDQYRILVTPSKIDSLPPIVNDTRHMRALLTPLANGRIQPQHQFTIVATHRANGTQRVLPHDEFLAHPHYELDELYSDLQAIDRTFPHIFQDVSPIDDGNTTSTALVTHGSVLTGVDFYDTSVARLSGSIFAPPKPAGWKGGWIENCGIPDVKVEVDTEQGIPVDSFITGGDGVYVLAGPMFQRATITMSLVNNNPNHKFSPESLTIYVDASDKKLPDVTFLSVNNVSLTVAGGLELLPVGLVVPRLILPTCFNGKFPSYIELPYFSDLPNTTYSVPALHYQLEVDNSPGDGSWGLQIDTPQNGDAGYGPHYASSSERWTNVHTWLQQQSNPATDVELRRLVIPFNKLFQYPATPEISLLQPDPNSLCADPNVPIPSEARFATMKARSYALVQFVASSTYGRATPMKCANVETSIDVIDYVTDLNNPVHVTLQTVYSNETLRSVAPYGFITGDIELDPQIDHQAPAYSRRLQYRLSGTSSQSIPLSTLHVVLVGKLGIGGSRPGIFPPYQAMYVLRDPPGGSSFAELAVSSSISADFALIKGNTDESSETLEDGIVVLAESHVGGMGIMKMLERTENYAVAPVIGGYVRGDSEESQTLETRSLTHTLTQTITTSTDPTLIDGQGDLFLTVSGTYQVQDANEILFARNMSTSVCTVTLNHSSTWDMDPTYTMQWVSRTDIENVVIPGIRTSLATFYGNYGIQPPTHSMDMQPFRELVRRSLNPSIDNNLNATVLINNSTLKQAIDLQSGAVGWEKLLNDSIQTAKDALPWPVLFQPVIGPASVDAPTLDPHGDKGIADGTLTSDQLIHLASEDEIAQRTGNAVKNGGEKPKIGSITFYGGMQTQSYTLATHLDKSNEDSKERHDFNTDHYGFDAQVSVVAGPKVSDWWDKKKDNMAGTTSTAGHGTDNDVTIHLGDPDQGDQFQMEVLRDMVYGGFVYKLVSGQSRCAWEPPTQPRDRYTMDISPRDFSAMSIHDVITAQLRITNSNHLEDLSVAVSLKLEENFGLRVSIDGQIVNWLGGSVQYASTSGSNSPIQVTVPANNSVLLLLVIERGPSPNYKFSIPVVVAPISMGGASCEAQQNIINIEYQQPTVTVEIVSPVASFISNIASSTTNPPKYIQPIMLRNPEHYSKGRTWLEFYNSSSCNNPLIEVQYRWQGSVPGATTTSPFLPVFNSSAIIRAAVENDALKLAVIRYDWDITNFPDGVYEVRARTSCTIPPGTLDPTPYEHVTTPIIARIDHSLPALFGLPTPPLLHLASHPADLSERIQVEFTEEIACDGQFNSKLNATMTLVNDPSKSLPLGIRCDSASGKTKLTLALPADETVVASLSGETVNVLVVGVVDLAGNGMNPNPSPPTRPPNSFSWIYRYANVSDTQISVPPTSNPTADPLAAIIPELAITPIPVVQPTNVTLQWQQGSMSRGAPSFVISYHRLLDRTWIDPEMQDILFSANPHYQIQINQATSSQVAQAQCIETDSQSDDSPPAFTCSVILLDWMPPSYADYVLASPKDAARITFAKYLATVGDNQWQFDVSQAMPGGDGPRLFDRYSTAFYFTSTPTVVVIKNVSQITPCASCTSPDPTFQVNPYSGTAVNIQWVAPLSNGLNSDRYNDTSLGYQISVQVMGSGATFVLNQWIWDSSVQIAQASSGGRVMHIQSHGHTKRHPIGARSPSSRKGIFVDFAQNPDLAYVLNSLPLGGKVSLEVLLTSNSTVGSSAPASFPIVWYAPLEPAQVLHVEQSNYNVVWYPDTFINDNSSSLYYTVWMSAPTIYTTFDSSRWSFGYINFANVVYDPSAAYSVQLANDTDYLHLKPIPGYSIFKVRIAIQQTDVMQQFIYSGQVQLVVQVLNVAGPSQSVHNTPFVYLPLPYFYKYWTFHVGNYNLNGYEQTFPFLVADLHVNQLVQLWEQMTKAIMIPDAQVTNDDDKWNFQDAVGMGSDPAGIVTYTTTNGDSDTVDLSLVSSLVVDFGDAGCRVEVSRDQMIEHLTNQDVGNVNTDSVASNTTSGVLQLRCLNTTLYKDKLDIVLKNPDIPISSGNEFIFTIGVTLNYFSTVHPFMIQQHKQLTYQATNVGIRVIGVLNDNAPLTVVGIDPPQTSDVTASDTSSSDTLTPPVVSDPSATISKNRDSSSLTTIVTLIVILVIAAGVGGFFIARRRAHQKHVNTPVADNSVVDVVVTEQTQNNV